MVRSTSQRSTAKVRAAGIVPAALLPDRRRCGGDGLLPDNDVRCGMSILHLPHTHAGA